MGPLYKKSASIALVGPANKLGVEYTQEALDEIYEKTKGYPYFIQEWGKHSWKEAKTSPINIENVKMATLTALSELDSSFFRVRFDRCTPFEKNYLRAMAELGSGPHKSGDIAELMGRTSQQVAPLRANLINKGMIYSPAFGDNNFTVPLFDGFLKRVIKDYTKPTNETAS